MSNIQLTKDEILEKQRAELLANYTAKSQAIQKEIREEEEKLKSVKAIFEAEFNKLLETNKDLENELRNKLNEANDKNALAIAKLKEAEIKLGILNAKEIELNEKHKQHAETVHLHANFAAKEKDDLISRNSSLLDLKTKAEKLMLDAEEKMKQALLKEEEIIKEEDKIGNILASIEAANVIQKELIKNNEQLKYEIEETKHIIENLKKQSSAEKEEAVKIRDDCDNAQARFVRMAQEIDKRNTELKAKEIQIQIAEQRLKDRKSDLDVQEGRLNELKNNVAILQDNLEKQQALLPKQGA